MLSTKLLVSHGPSNLAPDHMPLPCLAPAAAWEPLVIGACPQGYRGLRNWARANGKFVGGKWPYCDPCKTGSMCFEFKPGVGKCIIPANATNTNLGKTTPTITYLAEGEPCLDFSGGKKKWTPPNPLLFAKSCLWPFFSCNHKANGLYTCERVRDAGMKPVKRCYRAAGSTWWGGTDQVYYFEDKSGQFKPCGGPVAEYPRCPSWCKA